MQIASRPGLALKEFGAVTADEWQALFYLPEAQLILFVARASNLRADGTAIITLASLAQDSLIWAMKHEQPQVADSGLQVEPP